MTDKPAHLRKAQHNEKFLQFVQRNDSISTPVFPDWMVTVAFYVALHYVDAKLAELVGCHPVDHTERNRLVAVNLRSVSPNYMFLKNRSEYARYFADSERTISASEVQRCVNLALTKFK